MTHAECQDLLLDLAYGELAPARAAELESHLAGCSECRREQAALDEARKLAAPLRELEEPPEGLDEQILAAAKAQAQLDHDGDIGEVIEVQGTVKPLGLEAANIDALGKPAVRHEKRKPRWAVRVALGGSAAAVAALALVVSTSLQSRREAEQAARAAAEKPFEIRVQAPSPQPAAATQPAPEPQPSARDEAEKAARRAVSLPLQETRRSAPPGTVSRETAAKKAAPAANKAPATKPAPAPAQPAPAPAPESAPAPAPSAGVAPPAAAVQRQMSGAAQDVAVESAANLAQAAGNARHAGDYARAAALYRQASAARTVPSDAAWDLAHAVECLAAVGQFEEARKVRRDLAQRYPSEASALAATDRALRSADVVSPEPAK